MKSLNGVAVVAAWGALAAGGAAHAQEAVQWRVEDGGNGHWYRLIQGKLTWTAAQEAATAAGGHLATLTSAAENTFAWTVTSPWTCFAFLGGYQDLGNGQYAEPLGAWKWVTGEEFTTAYWYPGEPNNYVFPEDFLGWIAFECTPAWNDVPDVGIEGLPTSALLEWSADCNGDGIVDYGQCRDGSLPDYNGNSIPDCCEQGVPCEVGSYPVQWRVEDGGNGHWYLGVAPIEARTWSDARLAAEGMGGYLATFGTQSELDWSLDGVAVNSRLWYLSWGPFIGGVQNSRATSPTSDWMWIDGSEWVPYWGDGECGADDSCGGQDALAFGQCETGGPVSFNDVNTQEPPPGTCALGPQGLLIEFSADCNGDGIVDYGQILLGELGDSNANGVPDVCECDADINDDGTVNGADISVLLGYWGQSGKNVVGDITGDGIVNGADLALLLGSWGPCQ